MTLESIEKLRAWLIGEGYEQTDAYTIFDEIDCEIAELLDAEKEKTAAANNALNEVAGKWAKADAENRELKKMLLIDDGTVEDYTERLDLQAALDRQKALTDEFHEGWSEYRKACLELEEENDRLKREISERYMLLPVDADGVPIKLGDMVVQTDGEYSDRFVVEGFTSEYPDGKGRVLVVNEQDDGYYADTCRHVKPRTIESLLDEMCHRAVDACGGDYLLPGNEAFIAKEIAEVADELRSMGVGE